MRSFVFFASHNYYYGNYVKEDKAGAACVTYKAEKIYLQSFDAEPLKKETA
jgi:hypothetical protein